MIRGIELKKFKEIAGHGDSRTFDADIWMDGNKIGNVSGDGHGGCYEFHFYGTGKQVVDDFNSRVKAWAKESNETFETYDTLVEALILQMEEAKIIKKNLKKGYPVTLLCRWLSCPARFTGERRGNASSGRKVDLE